MSYFRPMLIHPRWYELPLGTYRSGELGKESRLSKKHGDCDKIRQYKEAFGENAL